MRSQEDQEEQAPLGLQEPGGAGGARRGQEEPGGGQGGCLLMLAPVAPKAPWALIRNGGSAKRPLWQEGVVDSAIGPTGGGWSPLPLGVILWRWVRIGKTEPPPTSHQSSVIEQKWP